MKVNTLEVPNTIWPSVGTTVENGSFFTSVCVASVRLVSQIGSLSSSFLTRDGSYHARRKLEVLHLERVRFASLG